MIGGLLRSATKWQVIHYIGAVVRKRSRAFARVRICFVPFAPLAPQAGEMNNVNRRCMPRSQIVRCVLETRLSGPVAWTGWVVVWEDGSIGAGFLPAERLGCRNDDRAFVHYPRCQRVRAEQPFCEGRQVVRELAERLAIANAARPGQPREVFADQDCLALSATCRSWCRPLSDSSDDQLV